MGSFDTCPQLDGPRTLVDLRKPYGPPVHTTTYALRTKRSVKQPLLDPDSGWYTVRCGSVRQGISSVMREVVARALAGAS